MDTLKLCTKCNQEKPVSEFYTRPEGGYRPYCKKCCIEMVHKSPTYRTHQAKWLRKDRKEHPEKYKREREKYKANNPEKLLWRGAKERAKEKNREFTIEVSDIVIPEFCPVLGIKIEPAKGSGPKPHSPSVDRIDSSLGYVKGNVRVISYRANALRSNATVEELEAVLKDLKKNLASN